MPFGFTFSRSTTSVKINGASAPDVSEPEPNASAPDVRDPEPSALAPDVRDPEHGSSSNLQPPSSGKTTEQRRAALEAAARGGSARAQQKLDAMTSESEGDAPPPPAEGSTRDVLLRSSEVLSSLTRPSSKSGKLNEQQPENLGGRSRDGSAAPPLDHERPISIDERSLKLLTASSTRRLSVDPDFDKEDSMRGAANTLCCICLEHPKSVRLSCGHMTTCAVCTVKLDPRVCPQCRAAFIFVQPSLARAATYRLDVMQIGSSNEIASDVYVSLFLACESNNVEGIKAALATGADPTRCVAVNQQLASPLSSAAGAGSEAAVEFLLGLDEIAKAKLPQGINTPLMEAAKQNRVGVVRLLVAAGHDLEAILSEEQPINALWLAAWSGSAEVVDALLEANAKLEVGGPVGSTPLLAAAEKQEVEVMHRLIAAKADIHARITNGHRPNAVLLCLGLHSDDAPHPEHAAEMVTLLLSAGISPNTTDALGATPLFHAAQGYDDVTTVLLNAKADVNHRADPGQNAILKAVCTETGRRSPQILSRLLQAKADPTWVMAGHGFTALMAACESKPEDDLVVCECVALLLSAGAGAVVNATTTEENVTALHVASISMNASAVTLLLEAGASVNASNVHGATPLYAALALSFMNANKSGSVVARAAEVTKVLVKAKAMVNVRNGDTSSASVCSPLIFAASVGDDTSVEVLLKAKADPKWTPRIGAETALIAAARGGFASCVKLLVTNYKVRVPEIDYAMDDGNTALHLAASNGHAKTVELLLASKASVDVESKSRTPLMCAAMKGGALPPGKQRCHGACIARLLQAGADPIHLALLVTTLRCERSLEHSAPSQALAVGVLDLVMRYWPPVLAAQAWLHNPGPKYWDQFWISPAIHLLRDVRTGRFAASALHAMFTNFLNQGGDPSNAVTSAVKKAGVVTALLKVIKSNPNVAYAHHHPLKRLASDGRYLCNLESCSKCSSDTTWVLGCTKCGFYACPSCADDTQLTQAVSHCVACGLACKTLLAFGKTGNVGLAAILKAGAIGVVVNFIRSEMCATLVTILRGRVGPQSVSRTLIEDAVHSLVTLADNDKVKVAILTAGGLGDVMPELQIAGGELKGKAVVTHGRGVYEDGSKRAELASKACGARVCLAEHVKSAISEHPNIPIGLDCNATGLIVDQHDNELVAVQFGLDPDDQVKSAEGVSTWTGSANDVVLAVGADGPWPCQLGGLQPGRAVRLNATAPIRGAQPGVVGFVRARLPGGAPSGDDLIICDFREARAWSGTSAELVVDGDADALRPGAKVRVSDGVVEPRDGWGVSEEEIRGHVGTLRCIDRDGTAHIDFEYYNDWVCGLDELTLAAPP